MKWFGVVSSGLCLVALSATAEPLASPPMTCGRVLRIIPGNQTPVAREQNLKRLIGNKISPAARIQLLADATRWASTKGSSLVRDRLERGAYLGDANQLLIDVAHELGISIHPQDAYDVLFDLHTTGLLYVRRGSEEFYDALRERLPPR